jgi:hypothetical protein
MCVKLGHTLCGMLGLFQKFELLSKLLNFTLIRPHIVCTHIGHFTTIGDASQQSALICAHLRPFGDICDILSWFCDSFDLLYCFLTSYSTCLHLPDHSWRFLTLYNIFRFRLFDIPVYLCRLVSASAASRSPYYSAIIPHFSGLFWYRRATALFIFLLLWLLSYYYSCT